jgi:hypothetical protein
MANSSNEIDSIKPLASLKAISLGAVIILIGMLVLAVVIPNWLPGLTSSLLGESPKVFWYLSRGSAMVAFTLLWMSMVIGLVITNRMARAWPEVQRLSIYTSMSACWDWDSTFPRLNPAW